VVDLIKFHKLILLEQQVNYQKLVYHLQLLIFKIDLLLV